MTALRSPLSQVCALKGNQGTPLQPRKHQTDVAGSPSADRLQDNDASLPYKLNNLYMPAFKYICIYILVILDWLKVDLFSRYNHTSVIQHIIKRVL